MRYLTAGESHGPALTGILEGLPAGVPLTQDILQRELQRRKKGYGRGDRQKIETDEVEILSGVRFGVTVGSPVALVIRNRDWPNWEKTMSVRSEDMTHDRAVEIPRPGHADYAGAVKYQHQDMRNVLERASARETTMRVALGAVAQSVLKSLDIRMASRVCEIGGVQDKTQEDWTTLAAQERIEDSPVRVLSESAEHKIVSEIVKCQEAGDTLGGVIEVAALNIPVGLGSYVQWDRKLDGKIGQQFLSLNAIKSVEIGEGLGLARMRGSLAHDSMSSAEGKAQYASNRAGGLAAGVTTGQILWVRAGMKPLSTLKAPLDSFSVKTNKNEKAHYERSDVCAVPSAAVIGESLLAFTILEAVIEKFGGDSLSEISNRVNDWRKQEGRHFHE